MREWSTEKWSRADAERCAPPVRSNDDTEAEMNRKVMIGAVAGLGAAACIAACARSGTCRSDSEPKPTVWDKMRKGMEEMPDDFPPRIMFDNVEATKANTDEILTLLKEEALATTAAQ